MGPPPAATSAPRQGRLLPASAHPCPHLRRDPAHTCHICAGTGLAPAHICTGTGLTPAASAPGLGSPLHRDWAHPRHICTGTGLTPPHLRRDRAHPRHTIPRETRPHLSVVPVAFGRPHSEAAGADRALATDIPTHRNRSKQRPTPSARSTQKAARDGLSVLAAAQRFVQGAPRPPARADSARAHSIP